MASAEHWAAATGSEGAHLWAATWAASTGGSAEHWAATAGSAGAQLWAEAWKAGAHW